MIAAVAPQARVVDLTHRVPVHDVAAGARVLVRASPWLSDVVLAVVDPGAGSETRAVAVEAVDRHGRAAVAFVGPDNGLLPPAVHAIGAFGRAVEIDRPGRAGPGGSTFAGRDVLAVAAARLCTGADLGELGPAVDPDALVQLVDDSPAGGGAGAESTRDAGPDGGLAGRVRWIDHFGNVELDIAGPLVASWEGTPSVIVAGATAVPAVIVCAYQEIPAGAIGLLIDSEGWASIAANRSSAAAALGLVEGDPVVLRPPS